MLAEGAGIGPQEATVKTQFYLDGIHRVWSEGGMGQRLCRTQQIPEFVEVMLVLLDGLHTHLLAGQEGLIAGGIAWWGQKFEFPMTAPQEEPHSDRRREKKERKFGADLDRKKLSAHS